MDDMKSDFKGTETERQMLLIWSAALENHDIKLNDTFLDLGGDSLSAMMCVSRIQRTFGIEVPIEEFFMDDGTITKISSLIDHFKSK